MPTITVLRVLSSLGGTARRYKINIDGAERATLAGGEEVELDVAAGEHAIQARIDWTGSEVVDLTIRDGETISYTVAPRAKSIFGQLKTSFGRHGYLTIKGRVPGSV